MIYNFHGKEGTNYTLCPRENRTLCDFFHVYTYLKTFNLV